MQLRQKTNASDGEATCPKHQLVRTTNVFCKAVTRRNLTARSGEKLCSSHVTSRRFQRSSVDRPRGRRQCWCVWVRGGGARHTATKYKLHSNIRNDAGFHLVIHNATIRPPQQTHHAESLRANNHCRRSGCILQLQSSDKWKAILAFKLQIQTQKHSLTTVAADASCFCGRQTSEGEGGGGRARRGFASAEARNICSVNEGFGVPRSQSER